ncbi:MAG TPA: cyclase family protein [Limnobacter sp.]|nr:cyclase family protein [Limnobacter sp.]
MKGILMFSGFALMMTAAYAGGGHQHTVLPQAKGPRPVVGTSPWGPNDEIGRLNLMTDESRRRIMARVDARKVYDLSVDYFIGMPGWHAAGDPRYQIWMTHTPNGTRVDDPLSVGNEQNDHVSYTGTAFSMYSHTGTHIDALNHFGLNGKIWNHFDAKDHLGDRGWRKTGAETIPPIIARGVLLDVAALKGVSMLPEGYRVTRQDIQAALALQEVSLQEGDVVLIRTGRMQVYENSEQYMRNPPGLGMDAARFLVEEGGAMVLGADNLSFEAFPSEVEGNYVPVHTYLLAQKGAFILELVDLEALAKDRVHEFAFIGASLKLKGADGSPMRPVALPLSAVKTGK